MEQLNDRVDKVCRDCNKPFSISQAEIAWLEERDMKPFTRCSECRQKIREQRATDDLIADTKTCRVCGKVFYITVGQRDWLARRGLHPFSKCPECRKRIRDQARQEAILDENSAAEFWPQA